MFWFSFQQISQVCVVFVYVCVVVYVLVLILDWEQFVGGVGYIVFCWLKGCFVVVFVLFCVGICGFCLSNQVIQFLCECVDVFLCFCLWGLFFESCIQKGVFSVFVQWWFGFVCFYFLFLIFFSIGVFIWFGVSFYFYFGVLGLENSFVNFVGNRRRGRVVGEVGIKRNREEICSFDV